MKIEVTSEADIAKVVVILLDLVKKQKGANATIVGLHGDLGAGKTTLTQHFAKEIGIKEKIKSPTFVLMKRYDINFGGWKNFYHIDAYRIEGKDELLKLGWERIISNSENLIFIEWPENVASIMPENYIKIEISHTPQSGRVFEF